MVVAMDTDVLVIFVHAYAIVEPSSKWFMKIDLKKYVDVGKVYDFLGWVNMFRRIYHIFTQARGVTPPPSFMVLGRLRF